MELIACMLELLLIHEGLGHNQMSSTEIFLSDLPLEPDRTCVVIVVCVCLDSPDTIIATCGGVRRVTISGSLRRFW